MRVNIRTLLSATAIMLVLVIPSAALSLSSTFGESQRVIPLDYEFLAAGIVFAV